MSFDKLPDVYNIEDFIEAMSKTESTLVPTVRFGFINNLGKVGLVRNSPDTMQFLPRATLKPRITNARASVFETAANRFERYFGQDGQIEEDGIIILGYAKRIIKKIERSEKDKWKRATGIVVVPVLVPVKMNDAIDAPDFQEETGVACWEEPQTALEILDAEALKYAGLPGGDITSADVLRLSMPFIPQVLKSLS
jgi:hypothetical protein